MQRQRRLLPVIDRDWYQKCHQLLHISRMRISINLILRRYVCIVCYVCPVAADIGRQTNHWHVLHNQQKYSNQTQNSRPKKMQVFNAQGFQITSDRGEAILNYQFIITKLPNTATNFTGGEEGGLTHFNHVDAGPKDAR